MSSSTSNPNTNSVSKDSGIFWRFVASRSALDDFPRLVSCFDVFDTLVARRVIFPTDVARLTYSALRHGRLIGSEITEDIFLSYRQQTERRLVADLGECTLGEIWGELSSKIGLQDPQSGLQIELGVERSVMYPIAAGKAHLDQARNSGSAIAFVSDSPLPEGFLHDVLKNFELLKDGDSVFVSSRTRKTKRDGTLYAHVAEQMGVPITRLLMMGDNLESDVRRARSEGCKAVPFVVSRPTEMESSMATALRLPPKLRSRVAGAARAQRLTSTGAKPSGSDVLFGFVAPCSLLWAVWCLRQAERRGIDRLFFMARDAYPTWMAARCVLRLVGGQTECRYLMASRRALAPISVDSATPTAIASLVKPWEEPSLGGMLRAIGLPAMDVAAPPANVGPRAALIENLAREAADIAARPDMNEMRERRRSSVLRYMEAIGFLDPVHSAIVDLGWHLSAQRALHRTFPEVKLSGLYAYINHERYSLHETGSAYAMIPLEASDNPEPSTWRAIARYPTLIEHLFGIAPHGSVRGYSLDSMGASAETDPIDPEMQSRMAKIMIAMERYFDENAAFFWEEFDTPEMAAQAFQEVLEFFFSYPEKFDLLDFGACLKVSSGVDNQNAQNLVEPYSVLEAFQYWMPQRLQPAAVAERPWRNGSLSVSGPVARSIIQARDATAQWIRRRREV